MARTDLAERVPPAVQGMTQKAGGAVSDAAGALRTRGGPAAAAAATTIRERAVPAATAFAGNVRDRAVPAFRDHAVPALRDHALPAAIAAGHAARAKAGPAASAAWTSARQRSQPTTTALRRKLSPVIDATAPTVGALSTAAVAKGSRAAHDAARKTKPQRKEAMRRAREVQKAARGQKTRRWPLLIAAFALGGAVGAVAGAILRGKRDSEPDPGGYEESLNGVHRAETQSASTPTEHGGPKNT